MSAGTHNAKTINTSAALLTGSRWHRLRQVFAAMLFLAGLGFALLRIAPLPSVAGVRLSAPWLLHDFRVAVYYPTQAFWHGANPYSSRTYLARYPAEAPFPPGYAPATFLVYLPAGFLPLPLASAGYFVLSLILTVVLAALAVRLAGWGGSSAAVLATSGALLLSRPGQWNLLLGQVTLPAVLGTYAAVLLARRTPAAAGVGIAFSLLKPTFGIPLVVLLLAKGARRAVVWGLGFAALANLPLLAVLVRREGGIGPFVADLLRAQPAWAARPANDPLKNVWRIDAPALASLIQGTSLGTVANFLVAGVVIGLACLALVRLGSRAEESNWRISVGVICCAVLLSVYHKPYDLLLLTLPVMVLLRTWWLGSRSPAVLLQGGFFAILGANYLTTESVLAAFRPGHIGRLALSLINGVALLGVFVLYLYQALERHVGEGATLPSHSS